MRGSTLQPSPAPTSSFIASTLPSSITDLSGMPARSAQSSTTRRVFAPGSYCTSGSVGERGGGDLARQPHAARRDQHELVVEQRAGRRARGRPPAASAGRGRSGSPRSRAACRACCRSRPRSRARETSGAARAAAAAADRCRRSRRCRAARARPCPPHAAASPRRPRRARPRRRACVRRNSAPAAVGATRRPTRSISFTPKRFSSWRTCRLTAGWLMPSRAAAAEKLFSATTSAKVRSWSRLSPRMSKNSLCNASFDLIFTYARRGASIWLHRSLRKG